jgi:hypothetical protein
LRIVNQRFECVDLRFDLRNCTQILDDIAKSLLYEHSLLIVKQFEPVIRLCRNDHRNEHRVIERRERIPLQIGLHKLQFVLLANRQQAMVAVFGRRKRFLVT